jgi:flagellin
MNNTNGAKSLEKLSSGYRINRAGDDAAGLAISEKMRAQIRGLGMASKNSQDAISLVQTAEGALSETQSILQRMRELAVQAANDTNVSVDRDQIQKEINQLTTEVNRIGNATEFNTMRLLNGDLAKTVLTSETVLGSGTKSISYGAYVAAGAHDDMKNALRSIVIGAGDLADNFVSANSTITVARSSTGITVTITGETGAGGAEFSAVDTIVADANGNYSYNNHGVSFSITAANAANLTNGETLTLENFTGVGTYGTLSDYTVTTTGGGTAVLSNISVTAREDNKAIRSITLVALTAGDTLNVIFGDAASGGTTLHDDLIYNSGAITYSAHGISFTLTLSGDGAMSGVISLTSVVTTNALTYDDNSLQFQVGANESQILSLDVSDMRASALSISSATVATGFVSTKTVTNGTSSTATEYALDVSSASAAATAITIFNDAITEVSEERAKLGSVQNRLEHTINNLDVTAENLQASESRIRDVDMAKEMMEFTKNNILMQAAQAMLAQANQQPQGVLQLLR